MASFRELVANLKGSREKTLLPLLDSLLTSGNGEVSSPDRGFHPSSFGGRGGNCGRFLFLLKNTPEAKIPKEMLMRSFSPRTHRIFHNGEYMHLRYQALFIELGIMNPKRGVGWEVDVRDEKLNITGHADGIIYPLAQNNVQVNFIRDGHGGHSSIPVIHPSGNISATLRGKWIPAGDPWLLELKSIGSRYFATLVEPLPSHISQAHIYMGVLGIKTCAFIYENKDTQEIREFVVPFNSAIWEELKRIIMEGVGAKLPKRVCSSTMDPMAVKCPMSKLCFSCDSLSQLMQTTGPVTDAKKAPRKHRSRG